MEKSRRDLLFYVIITGHREPLQYHVLELKSWWFHGTRGEFKNYTHSPSSWVPLYHSTYKHAGEEITCNVQKMGTLLKVSCLLPQKKNPVMEVF